MVEHYDKCMETQSLRVNAILQCVDQYLKITARREYIDPVNNRCSDEVVFTSFCYLPMTHGSPQMFVGLAWPPIRQCCPPQEWSGFADPMVAFPLRGKAPSHRRLVMMDRSSAPGCLFQQFFHVSRYRETRGQSGRFDPNQIDQALHPPLLFVHYQEVLRRLPLSLQLRPYAAHVG